MADTEREAFELYMSNLGEATNYVGDGMYQSPRMNRRFDDFRAGFVAGRALASRPAEVDDEATLLLREALPHIAPMAINVNKARKGPLEDAFVNTRVRRFLDKIAAPSHTTNKEKGGADGHVLDR